MDFNNLTAKVKVFQRRTTQKVLQQMGMADKTEDDSPAFQNFLALGSFASQIKSTAQATNACLEKACTAQTHLASQVQSYLHSELSGDGEMPPGELNDFFSGPNDAHGAILESIAAKFCDASTEIGHNALIQIIGQLDELVLRPIQKDEEFGVVTKELIEEKKRATLDYDSYRRMSQSATSASEHEKAEIKARAAKERYEDSSRRVAEHINQRNQIRCKLVVHGILTAIQQYCNFYAHAVDILRDTANSLKPLMDVYQMNDTQLQSTVNLGNHHQPQQQQQQQRARSPQQAGKVTADSLFTDYESQNRERGGKPTAPGTRGTGALSPQLDNMMRDNLNLKKPAAAPQQTHMKNVPMNQLNNANVGTRTPPPTHHNNNGNNTNNNTNNNVNSPHLSHNSPTHVPSKQPTPAPTPAPQPFGDLFDMSSNNSSQPKEEVLVDLMGNSTPAKQTGSIFDNDLFGSGAFSATTMPSTPAMQPSNIDILDQTFKNVNPNPSGEKVSSLYNEFDFLSPIPQAKNNNNNNINTNQKPQSQQTRPPQQQQQQKHEFDVLQQSTPNKQDERNELNPAVTQRIFNWAERGGRKANLRALLSTLHEVIWVDSGWDAMSLGELITPVQVKKAYHRANLIVHPDKVQNGTVEQQLMAQRLFEALRVSYETFKDEPK